MDLLNEKNIDEFNNSSDRIYKWSPFLEATNPVLPESETKNSIDKVKTLLKGDEKFPIKTHLPRWLAPENLNNNKTVICTRNPFDVHYSWWKFWMGMDENGTDYKNKIDLETFVKMMIEGEITYGSWFDFHRSWTHEVKTNPNVFVYHFEDLVNRMNFYTENYCHSAES